MNELNAPRRALVEALTRDLEPLVFELRKRGWPVAVVVGQFEAGEFEEGWFGVRVEVLLSGLPVPVESVEGTHDHAFAAWMMQER